MVHADRFEARSLLQRLSAEFSATKPLENSAQTSMDSWTCALRTPAVRHDFPQGKLRRYTNSYVPNSAATSILFGTSCSDEANIARTHAETFSANKQERHGWTYLSKVLAGRHTHTTPEIVSSFAQRTWLAKVNNASVPP